jgi:Tfp pilus assembly protein PilN
VDDYLSKFINHKLYILNCSLGPFSIEGILPLLPAEVSNTDEFAFDGFTFKISQNKIFDFIRNNSVPASASARVVNLASGPLNEKLLVSFSSAFEYFFDRYNVSVKSSAIQHLNEEYHQKNQFQFYAWSSMVFFFLLLLFNYFLFTHYSTAKENFQNQIALNQGYVKKYDSLQKEISEKQKFIEAAGLLEASRTSYYADQVAVDLPYSILLTDLNIQPVDKKSLTDDNRISFTPKTISVSGSCKKSYELNEWVKVLSKKTWLQNVSIINYKQDNEDGLGKFTLEIHIK